MLYFTVVEDDFGFTPQLRSSDDALTGGEVGDDALTGGEVGDSALTGGEVGEVGDDALTSSEPKANAVTGGNLYAQISPTGYDENLNRFIMKTHQIIPRIYLTSHPTVILHQAMGTGKTSAAINCAIEDIQRLFNIAPLYRDMHQRSISTRVIIVGNWLTVEAVNTEIRNSSFGLVGRDEQRLIESKLAGNDIQFAEAQVLINDFNSRLRDVIIFSGYKKLFTSCFPSVNLMTLGKDSQLMRRTSERVSKDMLARITNSIIIIDEMQNLYSVNDMNSYGIAVEQLHQKQDEYNFRMVFLTGTMLNTAVNEICSVLNIIRPPGTPVIKQDDYIDTVVIDNSTIPKIKPTMLKSIIKQMASSFIYYAPSVKEATPTMTKTERILASKPDYPKVTYVGSIHLEYITIELVQTRGYQEQEYKRFIEKKRTATQSLANLDEELVNTTHVFDAAIPPESQWQQAGININNGLYNGSFLKRDNVGQYSIKSEYIIDHCKRAVKNNEKTVLYHERLDNFSLYQYLEVLLQNGFVRYGSTPIASSICHNCGDTFEQHPTVGCIKFNPCCCIILSGRRTKQERQLDLRVYNSESNLDGKNVCVAFISHAVHAGASFLATNYLIILSRICNISRWSQICNRIIRMKSHALLPVDRRWVKIYTLGITYKGEKEPLIKSYYELRELMNMDIIKLTNDIADNCIGKVLLAKHGEGYKPSPTEVEEFDRVTKTEVLDAINDILYQSNSWNVDTLVRRLIDSRISATSVDLSTVPVSTIRKYVLESGHNILDGYISRSIHTHKVIFTEEHPRVYFNVLQRLSEPNKVENINKLLNRLSDENTYTALMKKLSSVMLLAIPNWTLVTTSEELWKSIFYIHDEYYETDDVFENYVINHSTEQRMKVSDAIIAGASSDELHKQFGFAGFYYFSNVILLDGTMITIHSTMVKELNTINQWKFAIAHGRTKSHSQWNIYVKMTTMAEESSSDLRKKPRGMAVSSAIGELQNINTLKEIFDLPSNIRQQAFAMFLLSAICDLQIRDVDLGRFMITPWESSVDA